jgi:predicted transcriptional regulator
MTTVKRTIELDADTDAALLKAAAASGLSPSGYLQSALEQVLADAGDLEEERRRWAAFEADGKFVTSEAVDAWVDSLGTASPLPKPQPKP